MKIKRGGSPRPIEKYISKNNDGINWIKISDADESGYINKTEEKIILEGVKNTRLVHKGDLLLSNSMSFGRPYILNIDGAIHDGWLLISEFINEFNKEFLRAYLESNICKSQYQKAAAGGVVSNLNKEIVKSIYVSYPSIIEQNKIARFLSLTDYKLEVLEAKIATLKKYKEGLVLKALKPTIENWKSDTVKGIRLSSFLVPYKKLGATKNYIHATLSREGISDKTERYNRDFLVKDENKKYRITDEGDLVYNPANLKFGVICINHYGICVVSPIYETFKVRNIDRDLLESIVTSKSFIRYALKFEEGTVYERRSVSVEDLLKIKVCLEDINQEKFVNILKTITDKLMLLSSMKEHCENLKQFLLRNMFI